MAAALSMSRASLGPMDDAQRAVFVEEAVAAAAARPAPAVTEWSLKGSGKYIYTLSNRNIFRNTSLATMQFCYVSRSDSGDDGAQ